MKKEAIDHRLHNVCRTIEQCYEDGKVKELGERILSQLDIKDELIHQQMQTIIYLKNKLDEALGIPRSIMENEDKVHK